MFMIGVILVLVWTGVKMLLYSWSKTENLIDKVAQFEWCFFGLLFPFNGMLAFGAFITNCCTHLILLIKLVWDEAGKIHEKESARREC